MHLVIPIKPNGYFEVMPHTVGATDEESLLFNFLPEPRVDAILANIKQAMFALNSTLPAGHC